MYKGPCMIIFELLSLFLAHIPSLHSAERPPPLEALRFDFAQAVHISIHIHQRLLQQRSIGQVSVAGKVSLSTTSLSLGSQAGQHKKPDIRWWWLGSMESLRIHEGYLKIHSPC
jgi:hypothetical protein